MQYIFSRQCAGLQAWFEQALEHEACTRNAAFLRNFSFSLLPLLCFSSFLSPVPKPKRRDDALGCWRWGAKEKEAVSDCKWKYFIDFSVKMIAESRLQFSHVCVFVCVCMCLWLGIVLINHVYQPIGWIFSFHKAQLVILLSNSEVYENLVIYA